MSTLTVGDLGSFGFTATPLTGTGRDAASVASLQGEIEAAQVLAQGLRAAIAAARRAGLDSFRPSDATLLDPSALPADPDPTDPAYAANLATLEAFFTERLGHPYAGSALTLAQWSQALDALERWQGASASTLPPGQGGGNQYVKGTWYVNGQAFALAELFTLNRVNTYAEIDRLITDSLNVIAANNQVAKALTDLMGKLFKKSQENAWGTANKIPKDWVDNAGQFVQLDADFTTNGNGSTGTAVKYPLSLAKLLEYAQRYVGDNSMISRLVGTTSTPGSLIQPDFKDLINEVEQIAAAFAEDNQVAQLQNQSLFNARTNLLDGLGAFLKGQQTTRSTLARNT